MVTKTTLRDKNGPCGAIRRGQSCSCLGFEYFQTVAGYRDCVCGHSQGIHAPGPPAIDDREITVVRTCPTCGQALPTEEAPSEQQG